MLKTQNPDYLRNKSVQITIVTLKIWNLSLRIQGKFSNINSAFFCSAIFSFAFLTLSGPGGNGGDESSPLHINSIMNLVGLRYMTKKKFFVPYLTDVSTFLGRTYFYPKKMVLLCSCNWICFHILTLVNLHYKVTDVYNINWWYMTYSNERWRQNSLLFYI